MRTDGPDRREAFFRHSRKKAGSSNSTNTAPPPGRPVERAASGDGTRHSAVNNDRPRRTSLHRAFPPPSRSASSTPPPFRPVALPLAAMSIYPFIHRRQHASKSSSSLDVGCEISLGTYGGHIYDHLDVDNASSSIPRFETICNVCLVESPWMRVARHTVL